MRSLRVVMFLEIGQNRLFIIIAIADRQIEHLSFARCFALFLVGTLVRLLTSFEEMDDIIFDEVIERRRFHGERDFLFVEWDI